MFIILSFAEVFNINYIIIKALKIGIELEKHIPSLPILERQKNKQNS